MRILENFLKNVLNQIITTFNFIFIGFLINLLQGKLKFINTLFIYFLIPFFFNFLVCIIKEIIKFGLFIYYYLF